MFLEEEQEVSRSTFCYGTKVLRYSVNGVLIMKRAAITRNKFDTDLIAEV